MSEVDTVNARAALFALTERGLISVSFKDEAIEVLARYFGAYRRAAIAAHPTGKRYRMTIGLLSDMRQAMAQFADKLEERLDDYADPDSSR